MKSNILIAVGFVILVVAMAFGADYLAQHQNKGNSEIPSSPDNSQDNSTTTGIVKTFTSSTLGIKFNYLTPQGDSTIDVIEQGDKVYVGGLGGQWVEEFSKTPGDDLKNAIRKKFLAGISEKDCLVANYASTSAALNKANVVTAEIKFGFQPTEPGDPRIATSPCPLAYSQANGIRYFWMDKNHSDKFFFFDIGQYGIFAELPRPGKNPVAWQDTFEVTK